MNVPQRTYDPDADSYGSWALGVAIRRERLVRQGIAKPRNDDERRQAAEGDRAERDYDAVLCREVADG